MIFYSSNKTWFSLSQKEKEVFENKVNFYKAQKIGTTISSLLSSMLKQYLFDYQKLKGEEYTGNNPFTNDGNLDQSKDGLMDQLKVLKKKEEERIEGLKDKIQNEIKEAKNLNTFLLTNMDLYINQNELEKLKQDKNEINTFINELEMNILNKHFIQTIEELEEKYELLERKIVTLKCIKEKVSEKMDENHAKYKELLFQYKQCYNHDFYEMYFKRQGTNDNIQLLTVVLNETCANEDKMKKEAKEAQQKKILDLKSKRKDLINKHNSLLVGKEDGKDLKSQIQKYTDKDNLESLLIDSERVLYHLNQKTGELSIAELEQQCKTIEKEIKNLEEIERKIKQKKDENKTEYFGLLNQYNGSDKDKLRNEFLYKDVRILDIEVLKSLLKDEQKNKERKQDTEKQEEEIPEDKMQEDKIQEDKMQKDKMQEDKIKEDKIQEDKMQKDKMQEDKIKEDKIQEDKIQEDKIPETIKESKLEFVEKPKNVNEKVIDNTTHQEVPIFKIKLPGLIMFILIIIGFIVGYKKWKNHKNNKIKNEKTNEDNTPEIKNTNQDK